MDIKYRREHNLSYMIIENEGTNLCTFEDKMIENNDISCLLKRSVLELDGKSQSRYEISKKESLRDYFENEDITLELIQKAFIYIQMGLEETQAYLLNQECLILSVDTIFFEKGTDGFKAYFCYNKMQNEGLQSQIRGITEWILTELPLGNSRLSEVMSKVYEIAMTDEYTISELIECIGEELVCQKQVELVSEVNLPVNEIKVEEIDLSEETDDLSDYYDEEKGLFEQLFSVFKTKVKEKKSTRIYQNKNREDFVIDPSESISEPTIMIRPEDMKCTGKLVYDGDYNEQNFVISGAIFKIGSAVGNDAVLGSKTVSRHHAKITNEDGKYLLEDLNSTNGTFVNGRVIEYRNPVRLKAMDKIQFGEVNYVFM